MEFIRQFFWARFHKKTADEFIWCLAEALLWRDENVSIGAIPAPIRQQPDADRYYNDAWYLIKSATDRWSANTTSDAQCVGKGRGG